MRVWLLTLVACAALSAGCRAAAFALLPPINNPGSSRDPDRTRPLVENAPSPYSNEERAPHGGPPADPLPVGRIAGGVSAATALLFVLGGAAPLIGVFGTFEENDVASP